MALKSLVNRTITHNPMFDNDKFDGLSSIQTLLESSALNLEDRDEDGQTYLMQACEKGSLTIVRELLLVDVDLNAIDNNGCTALMISAKEGHLSILIELLDKGADVEHRDMCNWTALMWACYRGRSLVVQELLERGALPNVKADFSVTCLTWAAGRGYSDIAQMLIMKGAKVNTADKYGTTPLIWAARKGHQRLVEMLLAEGANVDAVGMDVLTALIVATKGGYTEIVSSLLECHPNVNAVDKDGFTALMIAAKDCLVEILHMLLSHGAYVNVCDKEGESVLTHAVKGGHIEVVTALLARYADIDQQGADGKTALYWAIEKNHNEIVSLLLNNAADTEQVTKDGDTALMRSVRSRNADCVQLLLKAGAKVSPADKRGDTALHIALRARSKRITELLLRNPKNSRLLYKPNGASETPYSIDTRYQKGILTQIFGHKRLNANDGENLLGYEIYSSTLADILSEPSLSTPIIVGLYAKWGSGKSFLLSKLQEEMKNFMHNAIRSLFTPNLLLFGLCLSSDLLISFALLLALNDWHTAAQYHVTWANTTGMMENDVQVSGISQWEVPLGVGLGLFLLQYVFMVAVWVGGTKYESKLAIHIGQRILHYSNRLVLILKVLFCNPHPNKQPIIPFVRFLFSDYSRITSVGGEKSLAAMIGTLCDSVEVEYGPVVTRLARVFNSKDNSGGKFKSICCVPYFVICFITVAMVVAATMLLVIHQIENAAVNGVLIAIACTVTIVMVGNIYTWGQAIVALAVPQKSRVISAANNLEVLKLEGLMQRLKQEVDSLAQFVTTMDQFTGDQTRLVLIMDGLDSCEQDKIFYILDMIKALFSDDRSPFITILAVDPHAIIRSLGRNLHGDTHINGYDYLRNIVHLPFYLQSQGVRIQKDTANATARTTRNHAAAAGDSSRIQRQESSLSSVSLNESKQKGLKKCSQSLQTSSFDISKTLIKDDYFSDINPRSMRRLLNIVAVTGRLLRAYNIDFTWNRLAGWINVIEQWPYRISWIILHWEESPPCSESTTLLSLYQQIEGKIPSSRDTDPMLEIDRNVRKFVAFLLNHTTSHQMLNVGDLQKFLPITINLDPYLRKLIKEMQNNVEVSRMERNLSYPSNLHFLDPQVYPIGQSHTKPTSPHVTHPHSQSTSPYFSVLPNQHVPYFSAVPNQPYMQQVYSIPTANPVVPQFCVNFKGSAEIPTLSHMSLGQVCDTLSRLDGIASGRLAEYNQIITDNNITGLVLYNCDLDELKHVMAMRFGDWQIFRAMILYLRHLELTRGTHKTSSSSSDKEYCSQTRHSNGEKSRSDDGDFQLSVAKSPKTEFKNAEKTKSWWRTSLDHGRPLTRRRDSQIEQMKLESQILSEVLDEFTFEEESDGEKTATFFIENESPSSDKSNEANHGLIDGLRRHKSSLDPIINKVIQGPTSSVDPNISESLEGNVMTSHDLLSSSGNFRNPATVSSGDVKPSLSDPALHYPSVQTVFSEDGQRHSGKSSMRLVKPGNSPESMSLERILAEEKHGIYSDKTELIDATDGNLLSPDCVEYSNSFDCSVRDEAGISLPLLHIEEPPDVVLNMGQTVGDQRETIALRDLSVLQEGGASSDIEARFGQSPEI